MTVKKAYQLRDGDVLGEIIARVVKIEPPRKQTERQARAGIHNQSIFLQDPDGTEIRMVLIKPSMHIPPIEAGARFHFRSMSNDRGKLEGIFRKEWRKENGDVDHYLEANDCCRFYQIKDEAATTGKGASHIPADNGPLTMQNVAEFYCDIVANLESRLNGSALWDALVRDPAPLMSSASSIFIECNKRGILERHIIHAPATPQYESPELLPDGVPSAEPTDPSSEPMEAVALREALAGSDIRDLRDRYDISWEKVYDGLTDHLRGKGYEAAAIDAAYDHLRKTLTRNGSEKRPVGDVEYNIASEFDVFKSHVAKAQSILNEHRERAAPARAEEPPADDDWNPAETFTDAP